MSARERDVVCRTCRQPLRWELVPEDEADSPGEKWAVHTVPPNDGHSADPDLYPDWTQIRCYCWGGLRRGGEYPVECETCQGSGSVWLSPSGTRIAQYPGGPWCGVADEGDRISARNERAQAAS